MNETGWLPSSTIIGQTTPRVGRFVLASGQFQLVTDGTVETGGPGEAIDARELLVASLLTCALNSIRGGGYMAEEERSDRSVSIEAGLFDSSDPEMFGALRIDISVDAADPDSRDRYIQEWVRSCRIYQIVRPHFEIQLVVGGRSFSAAQLE